jgi:RNA 2',3'-cyclic 3'-phosphodiesterase
VSEALSASARRLGSAVRAFFAWQPPLPAQQALAELVRELRARPDGDAVRWVRPEGYHVTLRFLGNLPTAELAGLTQAAEAALADAGAFRASFGATRAFPSARQPRVVVVEVAPEAAFATLAERLEAVAVAAGCAPERRSFRSHLTLGRVRGRRVPALDAAVPATPPLGVREVVLFRSDLGRDGSRYAPLAQLPLAASRAAPLPLPKSL